MKYHLVFAMISMLLITFSPLIYREVVPPGTVKIVDNFYADLTEVTNLHWRNYQHSLRTQFGESSAVYQQAQPDTSVWTQKFAPFAGTYYTHPAYDNYPVVGISHRQATDFCRWRTAETIKHLALNHPVAEWAHLRKLEFRLPTVTEWEFVARLNRDIADRPSKKEKYPGKQLFNVRRAPIAPTDYTVTWQAPLHDKAFFMAPANAYVPGALGIHNLYGNVAEMVAEPGKAIGGSWMHTEREALNTPFFTYDGPSDWLGFRCICSLPPVE